jgi:hypothetical protein
VILQTVQSLGDRRLTRQKGTSTDFS